MLSFANASDTKLVDSPTTGTRRTKGTFYNIEIGQHLAKVV